jgi:hypothetical protein
MRVRTLEIRWHDSKPISTCDFQPVALKKARHASERAYTAQSYRLATGGEDNHVRVSARNPVRCDHVCGTVLLLVAGLVRSPSLHAVLETLQPGIFDENYHLILPPHLDHGVVRG